MIIRRPADTERMDTPHGVDARNLYNRPEAMLTHITLQPGESLKRHITPVDVVFYVLAGTGTVTIGDERCPVEADALVESPKGILHCWENHGDRPLRFLVVKTPRPTEKTIFPPE